MHNMLFVILSVDILAVLANRTLVHATNIINVDSNAGLSITSSVANLNSLYTSTYSLCITIENEEVMEGLVELFKNSYKLVTINDCTEAQKPSLRVFVLEINNTDVLDCEEIVDSYETTVVYVIQDSIEAAFSHSLEACLSMTHAQEVIALSLSDSSVFQLSPVFPQPRHFARTSVAEVLQRRANSSEKLDLQGSTLTIGALYYIPFFIYDFESSQPNRDGYDGIYHELSKEMARQLNFSCTYLTYKYYGVALNNGTWSGGLGQAIQEGKVDIVASNMWQVLEFSKLVDFGPALNKAKMAFLVLRPEVIDFQWQAILQIFQPFVWSAIMVSFVLTTVMYWVGVNWSPRTCTESWSACVLTLFGYFTSSTSHSRVNEGNTRFSLTSWSVFSLLITTSLSTGIVTRKLPALVTEAEDRSLAFYKRTVSQWLLAIGADASDDLSQ